MRDGLLVRPTGRGARAWRTQAIKAARDRSWEAYRSIERYSAGAETCRRRQILDHFGDSEQGRPTGRCCDVCDPDAELERVLAAPLARCAAQATRGLLRGSGAGALAAAELPRAVDERAVRGPAGMAPERAEGKPAYTVATDAALEEVLRRRPRARRS